MSDAKELLTKLFKGNNLEIPANRKALFEQFIKDEENIADINAITENQERLMAKWKLQNRIAEIMGQPVRILNASVGKSYEAKFDIDQLGWDDIIKYEFEGLKEAGLWYDEKTKQITGNPTQSGDIKIKFRFKVDGQPDDAPYNEKVITLIINPDPKTLWKSLESDKNDPYWKEDNVTVFAPIGDRHILVSSERGRSHANVGSFREDDFAFKDLENGWCLVVVSDGAGSAKISRKGSAIACTGIVDYFMQDTSIESMSAFDELLLQHQSGGGDDTGAKLNRQVYNILGKAVFQVHKKLEEFASAEGCAFKRSWLQRSPLRYLRNKMLVTLCCLWRG
jgi:hypothetical protein